MSDILSREQYDGAVAQLGHRDAFEILAALVSLDKHDAAQRVRIEELEAAVRQVEWRGLDSHGGEYVCPACSATERSGRHREGCLVAGALNLETERET